MFRMLTMNSPALPFGDEENLPNWRYFLFLITAIVVQKLILSPLF
jgi:hypothetical protein